jgi:L-lactate dehydrogenase complex protein LldG
VVSAFRARQREANRSAGTRLDLHGSAIKQGASIENPDSGAASTAHEGAGGAPGSVIGVSPVDRFVQELELLGGRAYRTKASDLPDRVLGLLHERGIEAALAWDDVPEISEAQFTADGVRLVHAVDPALRAGLTGAALAIAETGTLVLTSGKGRPLSTSLLPEIHVVILRTSQIVWSLEEALRAQEVREAAAVVLVSGPSRTADIEMTLTIGVHGPRELLVCIVE